MIDKRYIHKRITICKKCQGTGVVVTYGKHDYRQENPKECVCTQCDGTGRVVISGEINIKVEAYDPNKPL